MPGVVACPKRISSRSNIVLKCTVRIEGLSFRVLMARAIALERGVSSAASTTFSNPEVLTTPFILSHNLCLSVQSGKAPLDNISIPVDFVPGFCFELNFLKLLWGSRGARLGSFVAPLTGAGFSVLGFDAPGHGASAGRLSSLPQFIAAIREIGDRLGPLELVVEIGRAHV